MKKYNQNIPSGNNPGFEPSYPYIMKKRDQLTNEKDQLQYLRFCEKCFSQLLIALDGNTLGEVWSTKAAMIGRPEPDLYSYKPIEPDRPIAVGGKKLRPGTPAHREALEIRKLVNDILSSPFDPTGGMQRADWSRELEKVRVEVKFLETSGRLSQKKPLMKRSLMQDEIPERILLPLMKQLCLNGFVTADSEAKGHEVFQGNFADAGKECQGAKIEWSGTLACYRELYKGLDVLHKAGAIALKNSVGIFWEAHFDQRTDQGIRPADHRDLSNNRSPAMDSDREAIDGIIGNLSKSFLRNVKA
jgi:hypothetical protein